MDWNQIIELFDSSSQNPLGLSKLLVQERREELNPNLVTIRIHVLLVIKINSNLGQSVFP